MLNETLAEPEYARQVECVIMNTGAHMLCVCGYNVQQQVISMSSTQLFSRPSQPLFADRENPLAPYNSNDERQ